MRDRNDIWVGEGIRQFLQEYKSSDKLKEARINTEWERIVGPVFARHTVSLYLKQRYLYIRMDAASVKHELYMARNILIKALNKELGETVIEKIIFQ
jgi:predicted nucleic acid-binding Zn ribbon protein